MALGNGNPKYGDKGSNWSYEHKSLLQLKNIKDAIQALIAISGDALDFEAKLVVDANGDTFLEVRKYNPDTGDWETPEYYIPDNNNPQTPVAPLEYINPNDLLASIDTNTTGVVRTTGMLRPTTGPADLNTVQDPFYSVSVANVGAANGIVLGQTIKPNESLNFNADAIGNSFDSFAYDATGTEFIIIYVY